MPLALSGMLVTVVFWLAVTLIFGRVYCSVMCPVGTLQDVAARLRPKSLRKPYRYTPPAPWYVRAGMITILAVTASLDIATTQWALMPFIQVSPVDSYEIILESVTRTDTMAIIRPGWRLTIAAIVNLMFITGMGLMYGRTLCNSLCPLGGVLGSLNTMSLFQFDINTDACTHCHRCEDVCKASCINSTEGTVDASRCVSCFDCLTACRDGAIRYTTRRHKLSIPMLQSVNRAATAMTGNAEQPVTQHNNTTPR